MSESIDTEAVVGETDAPADRAIETLDVRAAGPPEPLTRTLERAAGLDDGTVLVQRNDRAPEHLYGPLEEVGCAAESVTRGDEVLTVIWSGR